MFCYQALRADNIYVMSYCKNHIPFLGNIVNASLGKIVNFIFKVINCIFHGVNSSPIDFSFLTVKY